jgi:simple sugar transport system permease protein
MSGGLFARLRAAVSTETWTLTLALLLVVVFFSLAAPRFLSGATFGAAAFQLPELALLTLAMLLPTLTGGLNLAITFTANAAGLSVAWVLLANGGPDAGMGAFLIGCGLAVLVGGACGMVMGVVIAFTRAHPILVSLSMMIFLRGFGEFVTRGGDVSNFPSFVSYIGHGYLGIVPVPLVVLVVCLVATHIFLSRTKLGFATYMVGSNIEAARHSGINTRRVIIVVYTLSGVICSIAGILMLARFNSIRIGHGESYILITILACFLGNVDPHGGFGRVPPVAIALVILQLLSSGANMIGANQHLATAIWGLLLIGVMLIRWSAAKLQTLLALRQKLRREPANSIGDAAGVIGEKSSPAESNPPPDRSRRSDSMDQHFTGSGALPVTVLSAETKSESHPWP